MAIPLSRPAGQDLPCWIYRLVSTGSLDETIVERQAGKTSLLAAITGKKLPSISPEDRALLFKLDADDVPSRLLEHLQLAAGEGARAESAYADADAWQRHVLLGDAAAVAEVPLPFLSALASAPLQELAVAMQAEEGGEADDEAGGDEAEDGAVAGDEVASGFHEGSGPLVSCMLHRFIPRKGSSRVQAVNVAACTATESAVRAVSGMAARSASVGSVLADAGASDSDSESEPDDEGCDMCRRRCCARDMSECEICTVCSVCPVALPRWTGCASCVLLLDEVLRGRLDPTVYLYSHYIYTVVFLCPESCNSTLHVHVTRYTIHDTRYTIHDTRYTYTRHTLHDTQYTIHVTRIHVHHLGFTPPLLERCRPFSEWITFSEWPFLSWDRPFSEFVVVFRTV